jgi:hypothetical protein
MELPNFQNINQIFTFLQTISLPEAWYLYLDNWLVYFFALLIIIALGVIFKGISLFLRTNFAWSFYRSTEGQQFFSAFHYIFFVFAIIFVIFGFVLWFLKIPIPTRNESFKIGLIFCILLVACGIASFLRESRHIVRDFRQKDSIRDLLNKMVVVCLLLDGSFLALSIASSFMPAGGNIIKGHVSADLDMEYIVGTYAPISVLIGGPDCGLSVKLFRDDVSGLNDISSLTLYSNNSSSQFNGTLRGNARGAGDYLIFLNTTSMSPGYYKFVFENPKYRQINLTSPFSLSTKN